MILIGLTGGIASGKTTVARLLEAKGAVVIDADRLGHESYSQGSEVHAALVNEFGDSVLADSGEIDRAKLGMIVFSDPKARQFLESVTHPAIFREISSRVDALRDTDKVVILDAALLVEAMARRGDPYGLDALVVVSADVEEMVRRMVDDRGMDKAAARARIAAQAPLEKKLAAADYVIDNRGSRDDLEASVDTLWADLKQRFRLEEVS